MDNLTNLAKFTKNDVIIAIITVTVAAILLYPIISKYSERKRKQYLDREKLIIDVIQENTKVNAGLIVLLEANNTNCAQCKIDQSEKMDIVIEKIDLHNDKMVEVATILKARGVI